MEASITTKDPQEVERKYRKFALLIERPERLTALGLTLRQTGSSDLGEVFLWLNVERFRAPSSTPLPYRSLARTEARNITAGRVAQGEAEALEATRSWGSEGWQTRIESFIDATPEELAFRLRHEGIDLLVSEDRSRSPGLASRAAALANCPLLLVPRTDMPPDGAVSSPGASRRARPAS